MSTRDEKAGDSMARHILELKPDYKKSMDIRGLPTVICPCGSMVWNLKAMFDNETGNISMYFMDMECAECGTIATAPTPEDYNVSDL